MIYIYIYIYGKVYLIFAGSTALVLRWITGLTKFAFHILRGRVGPYVSREGLSLSPLSPGSGDIRQLKKTCVSSWGLGLLRDPGRLDSLPKWLFYVDESEPFGESRCFTCTGAPFLQAVGPPFPRRAKLMSVLPAREATFFWSPSLRVGRAAQLGSARGGSRVTPAGPKVLKVVFGVGESTPFAESSCFA